MVEKIQHYKYPNDDGKRQRAWVTDCEVRGRSACERVIEVLETRPWVKDIIETVRNEADDREGIDIFMEMDKSLAGLLGLSGNERLVSIQVKSSEHEQRKFGMKHKDKIFNLKEKSHIFVLDGQDAKDVITADLIGQMIVLSGLLNSTKEEEFLRYVETELHDPDMAERYRENRELLLEAKWYGPIILSVVEK